ncbi:MAG: hypothetical protein B7Y08_28560 [Rhodospirillales bacterium 24-66-33]|jgi:hypothetical protein|nr:MAG: hypothetical protein B7Y57_28475 [Rhodospirillales bacterium 35-66-84]OYZ90831.1 MAG: hypothetical protein B7Y08_28560 [Rhodospirillales bacterium 24-66-33]OZB21106.1 MAG: hypothetical protein B7X63_28620 [Rhodospirillales bacterium 39-66-50]
MDGRARAGVRLRLANLIGVAGSATAGQTRGLIGTIIDRPENRRHGHFLEWLTRYITRASGRACCKD